MTDYRNRIKALEYVNADELVAHPGNWRSHPAAQAQALKGVLNEVGIAGALLAYRSERQGGALVVIDGHLRKDAAPQQWPVLILDVDDPEADYLLATHDPLAAMATADAGALDALLSSVQSGEEAVTAMLAELAEDAGLYQPQDDPQDAEPQIDRAEELREQWGVEPGQLWRLPSRMPGQEHRIYCGDSTKREEVARLIGSTRASLMVTDPPYGVAYHSNKKGKKSASIEGDLTQAAIPLSFAVAVENILDDDARLYLFGGTANWPMYSSLFDHYLRMQPRPMIWVKETFVLHPTHYHSQYETVFFGWKGSGGGSDYWYGDRKGSDVWMVSRDANKDRVHPTQKPVEVVEIPIRNSAPLGGIVYEPFSGSGTTIIAAENLSRQCRAVEISPGYVAVALQRYLDAFDIEAELVT